MMIIAEHLKKIVLFILVLILSSVLLSGCSQSTTSKESSLGEKPLSEMEVVVYYPIYLDKKGDFLVREVHKIPEDEEKEKAALTELFRGNPKTKKAYAVIPRNTTILSLKIKNGLATIDLSREIFNDDSGAIGESLGISSIVNTLTEFDNIKKVKFKVEGKEKGKVGNRDVESWWGHVGLSEQPFERDEKIILKP